MIGRGRGRGRGLAAQLAQLSTGVGQKQNGVTVPSTSPGQQKVTSTSPVNQSKANPPLEQQKAKPTSPVSQQNSSSTTPSPNKSNSSPSAGASTFVVENIFKIMDVMTDDDILANIPLQCKQLKTEEAFTIFMEKLCLKLFKEPDFAVSAAELCCELWYNPDMQNIFKKPLLSTVQQKYMKRSELREKSQDHFYGLSVFLCEIFKLLKYKDQHLKPLLPFVCAILKELIEDKENPNEEDVLYFYQEMESVGETIEKHDQKAMEEIINVARLKVISGDMKPSVRCRLVQLIELSASKWKLEDDVNTYYEDLQQDMMVQGK